jgi:hypothetical protein
MCFGEHHFIYQANLQHSIATARVLTTRVAVKGIDVALKQELCYHEDCIMGLHILGYRLRWSSG